MDYVNGSVAVVPAIIAAVFGLLMIIAGWLTFKKAGKPGVAIIIPIWNTIVMCQIAGKPAWWFILFLIPVVNIVIAIIVVLNIAKAFGKSGAFGFFLLLVLPIIGWPILGFGKAQYQGAPS